MIASSIAEQKVALIRKDFPVLEREVHNSVPLIYFDSAATSQKPQSVIDSMNEYYRLYNANIHRGVHTLAEEATAKYEEARARIAAFIGSPKASELVFTRNTTESINLVAQTWGRANLQSGDLVILTEMEHHSNLVPWQILAAEKGFRLEFIPVTDEGLLDLDVYHQLLQQNPKLVAFTQFSNVLGTINPAQEMIQAAHAAGALVLIDGAQSAPHIPVSVVNLGADFFTFSAHKMLGPTGIGGLWAKEELLKAMPPFLGGGDMIKRVYLRSFTANDIPHKFEAGTPAIAEAIGFGAAIDYLNSVGMQTVESLEREITAYAYERMRQIKGLTILGPAAEKRGGVISFTLENIHPHDVAQILDSEGIAVRAGHHCAMPLHDRFHIPATTRASFYLYNTTSEVDHLVKAIEKVKQVFGE
ncbi:MAG: cysteine desulfurase [Anaerolineaceae bacterium]|nr:cysteine desulfurase [Anaerolineaceae bacterium]